uniref:PHD finger protein 24-like n=1 Tax=Sinocyclocheilus rhinocerous TaxID=307959 RepID=A0A673H6X7_9TELE
MGVLMSKKQQVEKVQKCSVVVSAFKDGLKDRAAPAAGALTEEVIAENGDGSADGSHQMSIPSIQLDSITFDCRGAESPHFLSRVIMHFQCAVWPFFSESIRVLLMIYLCCLPLFCDQPVNDEMCEVCEVWTADDLFPCRTCTRVFHDGCLQEMGYLSTEALQEMRETAHTTTGWSCYYCVSSLFDEYIHTLSHTDIFTSTFPVPGCSCLVSDELLQYRHFVTKQLFERDLTDEEEEEVLAQFAALDPDKKGQIEWSDFLYHESLSVLQKFRTENSLVRILTAKERDRARAVFQSIDQDKDGIITAGEARKAQTSWFHKINKESQSCSVSISHVGPISESSPASSSSERSRDKALENDNRPVTWDNFLRESAIYILAARPNSSAMHIRLPL